MIPGKEAARSGSLIGGGGGLGGGGGEGFGGKGGGEGGFGGGAGGGEGGIGGGAGGHLCQPKYTSTVPDTRCSALFARSRQLSVAVSVPICSSGSWPLRTEARIPTCAAAQSRSARGEMVGSVGAMPGGRLGALPPRGPYAGTVMRVLAPPARKGRSSGLA